MPAEDPNATPENFDPRSVLPPETLTTVQDVPEWYKPYLTDYFRRLQQITGAAYPYPDQKVAGFTGPQQAGQNEAMMRALMGSPLTGMQQQEAFKTQRGDYLNPDTNPYLRDTYNQAAQAVSDQYRYGTAPSDQAAALRAGAFGGSASNQWQDMHRYDLGQNLNNLATDIYGKNYENERVRQFQEQSVIPQVQQSKYIDPQMLMGIGASRQALQQGMFDAAYQNQWNKSNWPIQAIQMQGAGLRGMNVGGSTTSPNPFWASGGPLGIYMGAQGALGGFPGYGQTPWMQPGAPGFGTGWPGM